MSKSELAVVYATLILSDDGVDVTAENISSILAAAGVEVEPYWPSLFAKLAASKNITDLITNVGAGGAAPAASASAGGAAAAEEAPKEEAKKEESEEEDADMGFSLFD